MQGFRDRTPEFEAAEIPLLGVSFDTAEQNRAFAEKYGYSGRLLSADRATGEAYQTARPPEDSFPDYAKRRTFVVDPDGVIRRAYAVKDIVGHPRQVLDDLRVLGAIA